MNESQSPQKDEQPIEPPGPVTESLHRNLEEDLADQNSRAASEVSSADTPQTGNHVRNLYKMVRNYRLVSILMVIMITALITFVVTASAFSGGRWPAFGGLSIVSSPSLVETDFTILGQYGNAIYTYNSSVSKVYTYVPAPNEKEKEIVTVPKAGQLSWHTTGKLALISDAENRLGNIYVYDLSLSSPTKRIATDRENSPNILTDFQISVTEQLAWADDGSAIAFTAENIDTHTKALFIYDLSSSQITQTPAKEFQKISSVVWITTTTTITSELVSFVGVTNNQEKRIYVNSTGAGYTEWP